MMLMMIEMPSSSQVWCGFALRCDVSLPRPARSTSPKPGRCWCRTLAKRRAYKPTVCRRGRHLDHHQHHLHNSTTHQVTNPNPLADSKEAVVTTTFKQKQPTNMKVNAVAIALTALLGVSSASPIIGDYIRERKGSVHEKEARMLVSPASPSPQRFPSLALSRFL